MKPPAKPPAGSSLRRHWGLRPGIAFLNHGSFGACPKPVLALQSRLRAELEAEPVQFLLRHYPARLAAARSTLASFVGARPRDLVFVPNATTGVNAVVQSLRLRPGDELLTTDHAYNACRNALTVVANRRRARVVVAPVPFPLRHADEVVAGILRAVTRRTRFALIDHVTSPTALVFPVARIVRELESRGIAVMVDGAHAPGMVPLRIGALAPSYYTGNLHKWVCAPKGAAFLWARADRQADLHPPVISHGYNTPWPGDTELQRRFEWTGTFDPTPWLCVGEAIDWMGRLLPGGWPEVMRRNRTLARAARERLCALLGVEPPCPAAMLGAMATVPLPGPIDVPTAAPSLVDPDQLVLYDRHGIEVPLLRFGTPPRRWCRISAQVYNSSAQYQWLATALRSLPLAAAGDPQSRRK